MGLASALFCLLLTVPMLSGHLYPDDRTIQRSGREDGEKGRRVQIRIQSRKRRSVKSQENHECQEGNPVGATYLGKTNVTISRRTCQVWAASQPLYNHSLSPLIQKSFGSSALFQYVQFTNHNYCTTKNDESS